MKQSLTLLVFLCLTFCSLKAQDASPIVQRYLLENQEKMHLTRAEAADGWVVSDQYQTAHNQVTHVYLQQMLHGLKLYNAISSVAIQNGEVVAFNSRFTPNAAQQADAAPGMQRWSAAKAVEQAAKHLGIPLTNIRAADGRDNNENTYTFEADGGLRAPVKVQLLYHKNDEGIQLAWNVEIQVKSDWWHLRVSAMTGEILDQGNYTLYCDFGHGKSAQHHAHDRRVFPILESEYKAEENMSASYRVFPFPGESPLHTNRALLTDPADPIASPYGWHDTNGQPGAEYTITRGNNVLASEDRDDNNTPGYSPDGGPSLIFDFPYNPLQQPLAWEDAAITNLFYANNFLHDMTYRHGFTEAAGNFQENNYGNGGNGNDAVQADAQDGSGTNNANFSTPVDGQKPRMQMYLWTGGGIPAADSITVNAPGNIAGKYPSPAANFGPLVTDPVTANIVKVEDGTAPVFDGCQTIVNTAAVNGKIAVIDRVGCLYTVKVKNAQDAGAIGVIVVQNSAAPPFKMPGADASITIPSVMISKANWDILQAEMANGPVNVSILPTPGKTDRDSDLDNGVIAHEFGHGISNRLTGGPSNSGCLGNAEQMGEGWSDFYALITTMLPSDTRNTPRGIGNYSDGQSINGNGIRNSIYSTDMSVNTYTYGFLPSTNGQVHYMGELWATMLWDLTWDLIDEYGFEPNLMLATGGNNIAQRLVTDGFKLQHCNPGFVDGRDGILLADKMNNKGANQCLIWKAFARRGLGYSASQGSSDSFTDGVQAFDLPPFCQIATEAPIAGFSVDRDSRCVGLATFQFKDESQNLAQYWLWDFGDGATSTETNPTHTYTAEGTYTVTLTVTNNIAMDTLVKTDFITVTAIPAVSAADTVVCAGQSATLSAIPGNPGNTIEWADGNGNFLYAGTTFSSPVLLETTTFKLNEAEPAPIQKVGPETFGEGSNHSSNFGGQLRFTAYKPFTLISALVRAQGAGNRTINLVNSFGAVIASATVNIPDGDSRIKLNLKVPSPGIYSLACGAEPNLFRNTAGTVYPFTIPDLVSITGTSSSNQARYHYFFDWEVQETPCRSPVTDVVVSVTPGPVAAFSFSINGLAVSFTNLSTGNPGSISWDFGDGSTSMLANPTHDYNVPGFYTATLTVSDGNCTTEFTRTIDFTSGSNTLQQDQYSVELSPNPASEIANLRLLGDPGGQFVRVALFSTDGRLVLDQRFGAGKDAVLPLDLKGLAARLYVLKVQAEAGLVVKKLVKE
jgi:PKD repeat protein